MDCRRSSAPATAPPGSRPATRSPLTAPAESSPYMGAEPLVVGLEDCRADCQPLVGGKAVGLGALLHEGLQVPPGFVVTTRAFREHIERNRLGEHIQRLLCEPH